MDNSTKDTLQALSAFVRHWRQDVASGLKPTLETLDYAEKMISAALKKEPKK